MSGDAAGRRQRPPSLYALGIVATAILAGVGLFMWGPINPNVEANASQGWVANVLGVHATFGDSQSVGSDGMVTTDLELVNRSLAPVRLTGVHLDVAATGHAATPTIARKRGVPGILVRGEPVSVVVTVDVRAWCTSHPGQRLSYRVVVDARTSWGVSRAVGGNGTQWVSCDQAGFGG